MTSILSKFKGLGLCLSLAGLISCGGEATAADSFSKGADVSWLTEMEAAGYTFNNDNGNPQDVFTILKDHGMDSIRLRVWVNPENGWNNLDDTIAKALRAQSAGMKIMIDFHYSDHWADPGQQAIPTDWSGDDFNGLMTRVWWYTHDSLLAIKNAGITPTWVQVGNETNNGMLWEYGKASENMQQYAYLTNSGYDAVKEVFPDMPVIVHLANCQDNANFRWIFDGLQANGGKWDIIGASIYPTNATDMTWQEAVSACEWNLNDMVSRYGSDVMVVEVGSPWDHTDAKSIVENVLSAVRNVSDGKGLGVFYWEPQAQNYNGYTWGAWDPTTAKPTQALDAFLEQGTNFAEGRYALINRLSGKALDIEGRSSADGANVMQWDYSGATNQQFDVTQLADGSYSIRAAHSGKSLDVYAWNTEDGGDIRQWSFWEGHRKKWNLIATGDGYYKVQSQFSGKLMEVYGLSTANGANISQWSDTGGWNQHWQFQKIN